MNKIITVVDPSNFVGNYDVLNKIGKVTKEIAEGGYELRSGKYTGIQHPFNEYFSRNLRKLNIEEFDKITIFEECPKTRQLMGSTRHYGILYRESEDINRYQKRVVRDKVAFDSVLNDIIGKMYKYVQEIYKEQYRVFLAQLIGTDMSNITKTDFVITNRLYKDNNIRPYDIINGTTSIFYDIMKAFNVESYDIRDL